MEKWKRQALHYIAFEIDPQHTLNLTTQKACGIYYTYVPQHTIPFRSLYCIARISFTANHTLVVTTFALYDILLLRITSSSSLALALAPALLQPPSSLLFIHPSIHPSLRTRVQPYISSLMLMAFVAYLFPCFIYTESGPGLRESGFCFFFHLSTLSSFILFVLRRIFTLPYFTSLVCFTFWF